MEGIADFLDSLVGGVNQICYCMAIGGIIWGLFVLRPWNDTKLYNVKHLESTVALTYQGTVALAVTQAFALFLKIWLMAATLEIWPFPAFAHTLQFKAGMTRLILTVVLAFYIKLQLRPQAASQHYWQLTGLIALPVIISGAWLVHGAGRFNDREQLMLFTVLHQVAAAAWIGGVFQLLNVWRLHRHDEIASNLWPTLLRRFAATGIAAVSALLLTGLPLAFKYIDTWNGFLGTGYGNLLLVKILLLGIALGLAFLNHRGAIEYQTQGSQSRLYKQIPYFIQAETFVLISLLFTAASLSSQPPAVDIHDLTASASEVLNTFAPRAPRISSPTHEALLAGEAGRTAIVGQVPSPAATEWSDYNHNISGIFLTVIALFAMLSYLRPIEGKPQYWPLGFAALGIFLFFRSDAETWPLGPIGFWESTFTNGEVLQHRIATFLVFGLGLTEYRARLPQNAGTKLPFVFPVLAAFGGLMLLTHSHVGFQAKTAFLIQIGHTLMGVFAIVIASSRWLEIQLDGTAKRIAGFVSVAALFQIGIILMFYREPLY
ncbi:MAG: copper resistance D family protein [Gammaproteobacteria bacterium]